MIENMPARLELHFKLRNRERPRTERLHQPALEIKEPQQPPRILLHRELPAKRAVIARKLEWIARLALQRRFVLTSDANGWNDGLARAWSGVVWENHRNDLFVSEDGCKRGMFQTKAACLDVRQDLAQS